MVTPCQSEKARRHLIAETMCQYLSESRAVVGLVLFSQSFLNAKH